MAAIDNTTRLQDANVIAQAFERGAHYNTDEASVFATKTRNVQNTKAFAQVAQSTLSAYQYQPSLAIQNQTSSPDASTLSGMKIQNQYLAVPTAKSSSVLSRAVKDCIPCLSRILHNIDLNVSGNLIKALKTDVTFRLNLLNDLKNLLSNIDIYGDFCQMASFLNFMCVPDLQRMTVILMAMLTDFSLGLLNVSGLIQGLLAPFFTPVLMSINSLLDQLTQLVLSPLTCIITSIEQNITKLDVGSLVGDTTLTSTKQSLSQKGTQATLDVKAFQGQMRSSLMSLHQMLNQGNTLLRNKLAFYTDQLAKLLGQWGLHDTRSMALANQKIICLRLIGLIRSMIQAKTQGAKLCNDNQKPSASELDNFFSTYVSPNSPFNLSVDSNGDLQISPKQINPIQSTNINSTSLLTPPTNTRTIKCALSTTTDQIDQVNIWISQLNKTN